MPDYFKDSKGIYSKGANGERTYLSEDELQKWDVEILDYQKNPSQALSQNIQKTKAMPAEYLPRTSGETPFKLGANALSQILELPVSAVGGLADLGIEGAKAISAMGSMTPIDFSGLGEPTPMPDLNSIGGPIVEQLKQRYTGENFKRNPATLPLDALSVMSPKILGKGIGALTEGGKNKLLNSLFRNRYAPKIEDAEFAIDALKAGKPSRLEDVVSSITSHGGATPTVGQLGGDIHAIKKELSSPLIEPILESQFNTVKPLTQEVLNTATPVEGKSINIGSNPTEVARNIRASALRGYRSEQKAINLEMADDANQIVSYLQSTNPTIGTLLKGKKPEEVLGVVRSQLGKTIQPDPTLERLLSYSDITNAKMTKLRQTSNTPMGKLLLTSRDKLAEFTKKASVDPLTWDNWKDPDYTKIVEMGTRNPNEFSSLASLPGIGQEKAAQLLVYKLINDSKVENNLSPYKLYQNFSNPNNASMLKVGLSPKGRVGIQQFAHTMKTISKYDETMAKQMAMTISNKGLNAQVSGLGAFVPMALGGNFAQMRGGYAAATGASIIWDNKVLAKILVHPSGPWLMERLGKLPKSSPSVQGTIKSILKVMGELNIPAKFDVGGEEIEIPPIAQ